MQVSGEAQAQEQGHVLGEVGVYGGLNERHTVMEYQRTVWVGNTSGAWDSGARLGPIILHFIMSDLVADICIIFICLGRNILLCPTKMYLSLIQEYRGADRFVPRREQTIWGCEAVRQWSCVFNSNFPFTEKSSLKNVAD
jgi:hypothetical protein